jgi:hypothetical protein
VLVRRTLRCAFRALARGRDLLCSRTFAPPRPAMSQRGAARRAAKAEMQALVSYAYGTLLMAGGFLHQVHAHEPSAVALYAGLGLGTAIWACERAWFAADSAGLRRGRRDYARARVVTAGVQTAVALALTLDKGRRWALTQLFIPPGLVAAASAVVALLYGSRLAESVGI